jgi:membrane protein
VRAFPSSTATEHTAAALLPVRARVWLDVLERTGKAFLKDDCMGLAQQIAFSSLLAFFPAVILVIGLLGLIPGAYGALVDLLDTVAPKAVLDAIDVARQSSAGAGAGSAIAVAAGTAGALWAASGATDSVIKAVNRAEELVETRPFWRVRLLAFALVLLAGLVLALVFVLIVFGAPLGDAVARRAGLGDQFATLWAIARWPIAFTGILLSLGLIYYLAPAKRPPTRRSVIPGAVLGGALWLGLSGLFALYTSFSGSYDRTYGSLAGAIVLLLWLNYSAVALLFGAELNAELRRRSRQ